jgi:molecular chaperone DnaK (HSP70)
MNQPNDQNEKEEEPGLPLGIDLGNSKISAAIWNKKKKAPSIVLIDGKQQMPSTIYFKRIIPNNEERKNEEINITEDSFDVGVDYSSDKNVNYYIYDIKKILGQKTTNEELEDIIRNLKYKITEDQDNNILYSLEGNGISFDILLKLIINKIKISAESQFNDKVINCTISVPHSFTNNQRLAIKNAAYNSGIKNIYIINEPLSTAIYYASKNKIQKNENILIVDFGSSKLDVTLLSVTNKNSIKVRETGGDATLGGDIFNSEMKNDILRSFKIEGGSDINEPEKLLQLENLIEKAKKE